MSTETDSVLLAWRDALDNDLAALDELHQVMVGRAEEARAKDSGLDPAWLIQCMELMGDVNQSLMQTRMEIHALSVDAGEESQDPPN